MNSNQAIETSQNNIKNIFFHFLGNEITCDHYQFLFNNVIPGS